MAENNVEILIGIVVLVCLVTMVGVVIWGLIPPVTKDVSIKAIYIDRQVIVIDQENNGYVCDYKIASDFTVGHTFKVDVAHYNLAYDRITKVYGEIK